jgi:hypothetical protein
MQHKFWVHVFKLSMVRGRGASATWCCRHGYRVPVMYSAWVQYCQSSNHSRATVKICTWINNVPLGSLDFVCGCSYRLPVSINDLYHVNNSWVWKSLPSWICRCRKASLLVSRQACPSHSSRCPFHIVWSWRRTHNNQVYFHDRRRHQACCLLSRCELRRGPGLLRAAPVDTDRPQAAVRQLLRTAGYCKTQFTLLIYQTPQVLWPPVTLTCEPFI